MDRVYAGIERFRNQVFPSKKEHFERLESGQQPQLLLITCSDSRIDPALLTQTEPGEVFVVRNAGNIVAPWGDRSSGEAATVEYGIRALGIRDIAVCGHTHCGAMAALRAGGAPDLPAVDRWLELGREALARSVAIEPPAQDPLVETVAANVLTQLDHLRTHPCVAEAESRGELRLHGWIYDFGAGELLAADADGCFRPLRGGARDRKVA